MMRTAVVALIILISSFCLSAANRALLVGIGRYPAPTGWSEIHGDADVCLLSGALKSKGFTDVKTLTNSQATKRAIVGELKKLASRCRAGDKVYFHFSGHGQHVTDINGDEGRKGYDESIVPYDACKTITSKVNGRFYNGENHLIDDELNPLFAAIKKKLGPRGELFIAIDACYSEDIERAPGTSDADLPPARGTDKLLNVRKTAAWTSMPRPGRYRPGARMYVVSACKTDERNYEYRAPDGRLYGSLSYFLYTLTKTTTDFKTWANKVKAASSSIFQPAQHPQARAYK